MISIRIRTSNAAFHEDDGEDSDAAMGAECARILRELAAKLEGGPPGRLEVWKLYDVNGNGAGTCSRGNS